MTVALHYRTFHITATRRENGTYSVRWLGKDGSGHSPYAITTVEGAWSMARKCIDAYWEHVAEVAWGELKAAGVVGAMVKG